MTVRRGGAPGTRRRPEVELTQREAKIARDMYDELGPDGKRAHTVQRIADEFGVTRPTIYRHLQRVAALLGPNALVVTRGRRS